MMPSALLHRTVRAMLVFLVGFLLAAPAAGAYQAGPVTDGGTITGVVRVIGEVAPLPPQPVWKHITECGKTVPDDRLLLGPGGALGGVVVSLIGIDHGKPIPTTPATINNRKCAFVPHVLSASVGQTLEIVNDDPFLHDAHAWLGDRTLFNLAIPRGRTVHAHLQDAGLIHINCNVRHTWMHAYLFVADHPYHAVTDEAGRFTITDVPAGTHHLRVWHELLGSAERDVVVPAGGTVQLEIPLSATAPDTP